MFDRNEDESNERTLFEGRPNFFFGCKNIFLLFMLLGVITYLVPKIISFAGEMQIYLIDVIDLPLASYTAFFFIIIYLLIFLWIIWIVLNWKATNYTITNFRLVLKKGILIKNSYYMPFSRIQDILVSQGIIGRIVSIGDVVVVSAYDATDIRFININNPDDIQELIFTEVNKNFLNLDKDHNNMLNDKFTDYDGITNDLKNDNYYQKQNLDNNFNHYDNLNLKDNYINQNNDKKFNNNPDYLDHDLDEAMIKLNRNNRFTNEQRRNNGRYRSRMEYDSYENHDPYFKRQKYKKNRNVSKKKDKPSVIDSYSKKFKKYK